MRIISQSASDTLKIGRSIARNVRPGDIICLSGQLGAGKTVLTKGIAQGLGIKKDAVISPSFVLIRQHKKASIPLYHFDLYRLQDTGDILGLGYEEYLYDQGVAVIEWSERLKSLMPQEYLHIKLCVKTDAKRALTFAAHGARYQALLKEIHENIRD